MKRWTGLLGWFLVCWVLVAISGAAENLRFTVSRVEESRAFQAHDGFHLVPLAHTEAVNIRANRLEGRIKRHVHPQTDHFLYIIDGQIELTVGDQTQVIGAGDFVTIPRGVPHAMQRLGESAALFLDVAAPPDVGDVIWQE
jgi:quercetin dioxygenase-like cupin family protein